MEEALVQLIEKIMEISPYVWEIAVRQAYVNGIVSLFTMMFSSAGTVVAYAIFRWAYNSARSSSSDDLNPAQVAGLIMGFAATFVLPIVAYFSLVSAFRNLANPAYAAIHILLQTAGIK